jgi:hypothetical protein
MKITGVSDDRQKVWKAGGDHDPCLFSICSESTTTVSLPGQISTWPSLVEHVATSLCTGYSLNDPVQKDQQLRRNLPEEAHWVKVCDVY